MYAESLALLTTLMHWCNRTLIIVALFGIIQPKHSTLSALIQMCDEWLQNLDNGNLNCVVFLDVRKAFDSFGIIGTELEWFKSYLTTGSNNVQ